MPDQTTPPEQPPPVDAWTGSPHELARHSRLRSLTETVGATVLGAGLALLSTIVQARILGPSGRGEVVFLTVLCNITAVFAMGGVQAAHTNILSQEPEKSRAVATNSLVLGILLTAVVAPLAALVLAVANLKVQDQVGWQLTLAALGLVVVMVLHTYFRFLAIAQYRFRLSNFALLVVPITTLSLNVLLGALDALTVELAFAVWVLGHLIGLAVLLVWAAREVGFGRWSAGLARRAIAFGSKSQISQTMQLANFRLDQMFVGGIAGSSALGTYSVAVAWSETLFYLPEAMAQVQRPDVARAKQRSAADDAAQGLRLTLIVTTLSVAVMALAAPFLVDVVFGEDFSDATVQLQVLVLGAFGIATVKLLANLLTAQNHPLATAPAVGTSLVVTIVLDILLIPSMEGLGAAIASSVAYTVGGLVIAVEVMRRFRLGPRALLPGREDLRLLRSMITALRARPADRPAD